MKSENDFSESQKILSSAKFLYRKFNVGSDSMLAVCDKSVIGKSFDEGDLQLHVSEEFYSENECSEKEIVEIIKSSTIINAVGKDVISIMLKNKLIDKNYILEISGVPHAQVISVQ